MIKSIRYLTAILVTILIATPYAILVILSETFFSLFKVTDKLADSYKNKTTGITKYF